MKKRISELWGLIENLWEFVWEFCRVRRAMVLGFHLNQEMGCPASGRGYFTRVSWRGRAPALAETRAEKLRSPRLRRPPVYFAVICDKGLIFQRIPRHSLALEKR